MHYRTISVLSAFALLFVAAPAVSHAQMGMMGYYGYPGGYSTGNTAVSAAAEPPASSSLSAALAAIEAAQGVTSRQAVDCAAITDAEMSALGDGVMDLMVPNQSAHDALDAMMGGEGSANLAYFHENLGRSYLGCPATAASAGNDVSYAAPASYDGYGFMPFGMMGGFGFGSGYGFGSGDSFFSWAGMITMILVWVLLALGIAELVHLLRKK